MKIKLLIFIFYLVIGSLNGQSLTTDENKMRLGRCGREIVKQRFSNIFSWVQSTNAREYINTAALISSRHILMPSRVVLHERKWVHNDQLIVDLKNCENNENGYIQVPRDALDTVSTGWTYASEQKIFNRTEIFTRAVIFCNTDTNKRVDESSMSFPMIVEISPNISKSHENYVTFCLPSEDYQLRMNEPHDFYQYKIDKTVPSKLNILSPGFPGFFYAEKYEKNTDGILTDNTHLVGLGVNTGDGSKNSEFHKIQWYTKDFCVLFGICNERFGKLTKDENEERLEKCGFESSNVFWGTVDNGVTTSKVTVLSSRHALMTSNVLVNKFLITANGRLCLDERIRYFQVIDAFSAFKFSWNGAVTIKEAYIICDKRTFEDSNPGYNLPMIIEISPNFPGKRPCLPDGTKLDNDGLFFEYNSYIPGQLMFKSDDNQYIKTSEYTKETKSGNPLYKISQVEKLKEKWTLVGVSTGVLGQFFSVQWMLPCICELTGICQPPPLPTVAPTTEAPTTVTTTPPTTEAPTTDKVKESTTESENTTTPTIPDPSTTKESPSPEPTMEPIPVIDLDQEYKEFKEREAEDDKGDWDEWGNDFYRSADFFEGSGRRIELFVGFLMVVMVVWRMILG